MPQKLDLGHDILCNGKELPQDTLSRRLIYDGLRQLRHVLQIDMGFSTITITKNHLGGADDKSRWKIHCQHELIAETIEYLCADYSHQSIGDGQWDIVPKYKDKEYLREIFQDLGILADRAFILSRRKPRRIL